MLLSFVCLMFVCLQIFLEVCAANFFYTSHVIRMKPKCRCARQIDWSNNHLYPLELNFCASHRFHIAYVMKIKIYICEKHRDLMCKTFLKQMIKALHGYDLLNTAIYFSVHVCRDLMVQYCLRFFYICFHTFRHRCSCWMCTSSIRIPSIYLE